MIAVPEPRLLIAQRQFFPRCARLINEVSNLSLLVGVSGNATLGIMVTGYGLTRQKASHGQQNHKAGWRERQRPAGQSQQLQGCAFRNVGYHPAFSHHAEAPQGGQLLTLGNNTRGGQTFGRAAHSYNVPTPSLFSSHGATSYRTNYG